MRSRVATLHLELEYARQGLEQARIALAGAEWDRAPIALLGAKRKAVRDREAYLQLVRREYEAALRYEFIPGQPGYL